MKNNLSKILLSMQSKTFVVVALVWLLLSSGTYANNIKITHVSLTNTNFTNKTRLVNFNIGWENSWRTSSAPYNWDAAWVFVKYRVSGGAWQHAKINSTGHTAPTGSAIDIGLLTPSAAFDPSTNPGLGAFIYRSANGTGGFPTTTDSTVKLLWNFGDNGVGNSDLVDIQVFAIEMVYVPMGSFYAGDGTTTNVDGQFNDYNSTNAYQITSESVPVTLGGSASGNMRNNNVSGMVNADDFNNTTTQTLPAVFPKGYNAFYCMKYEISQQGYVDFLNNLTQTQATSRKYDKPTTNYRYEITGSAIGSYTTSNPYLPNNWMSWDDLAAYLDWSGLRPMTELEFEKACRGTLAAVQNECAWGNPTKFNSGWTCEGYTFSGLTAGTISEVVANPGNGSDGGNAAYWNTTNSLGPLRVGSFATSGSSRIVSGATYYGVMDMSGNVYERPITVGNSTGRSFTGTHGDGVLDGNGNANVSNWPTAGAAGTIGAGFRGGYFFTGNPATDEFLRVSSRANASAVRTNDHRGYADAGGRGIRTAPTCINPTNGGTIAANQTGYSPFSPTTFDPDAFTSSALPSGQTGNLEYKWMVSTTSSSSGFSDISNSNAATYDPGTISVNTWYKRVARVNCMDDWTGAAESNVVTATVSAAPATSTFSGTGNWNQASYWNNGIPAYTTQAFISGNCTITTPSTCSNLTINPTGQLTVNSSQTLAITGQFLIKSTAAGTGSYINNGTVTYALTPQVERYILQDLWHYISSPVQGAVSGTWLQCYLASFNEATQQWNNSTSSTTLPLTVGQGFKLWSRSDMTGNVTRTYTGNLNEGDKILSLSSNAGWKMIGNPFTSAITADIQNWTKTNVNNAIWVWDPVSNNWQSWDGTTGTLTGGVIPASQGFHIVTNNSGASVTIMQSKRVHSAVAYHKEVVNNNLLLHIEGH